MRRKVDTGGMGEQQTVSNLGALRREREHGRDEGNKVSKDRHIATEHEVIDGEYGTRSVYNKYICICGENVYEHQ